MKDFITFKNVTKSYTVADKTFDALKNISFTLPKGNLL